MIIVGNLLENEVKILVRFYDRSGKTLAYIIPALMHIVNQAPLERKGGPIALGKWGFEGKLAEKWGKC